MIDQRVELHQTKHTLTERRKQMSRTKDAFIVLGELAALKEYIEDEVTNVTDEDAKFYAWAIQEKTKHTCETLRIKPEGLPEFAKWYNAIMVEGDDLLEEYADNFIDLAQSMLSYFAKEYKAQVA